MKAAGFKQLKRKEGLSFYLKGFVKDKHNRTTLKGCNQGCQLNSCDLPQMSQINWFDQFRERDCQNYNNKFPNLNMKTNKGKGIRTK